MGVVTISEAGLAKGLTDGMIPRIVPDYPGTSFGKSPDMEAIKQQLDPKGRVKILEDLQG